MILGPFIKTGLRRKPQIKVFSRRGPMKRKVHLFLSYAIASGHYVESNKTACGNINVEGILILF